MANTRSRPLPQRGQIIDMLGFRTAPPAQVLE